jgi:hypothetical protein
MTPPDPLPLPAATTLSSPAQKAAATVLRHKDERRAERLREIRAQIADGTLVIRQMTDAEHETASPAVGDSHPLPLHRGKQQPK